MARNGVESFLRAEEEANRLVEVLRRLKEETESHKTAREALDQAAAGVSELSTRCAEIAEQLGGLAKTLRSIGTPELLLGLEAVTKEVGTLQQDLNGTRRSIEDLANQLKDTSRAVQAVRNLALWSVALLVVALAVLGWIALSLARS